MKMIAKVVLCLWFGGVGVASANQQTQGTRIDLNALLVRATNDESCPLKLLPGSIKDQCYSRTPLINLIFQLQVKGFQLGFIQNRALNPGQVLRKWKERRVDLYSYMVSHYPDSMSVRDKRNDEMHPVGAHEFFRQLQKDWEAAGGRMDLKWIEPRIRSARTASPVSLSKTFLQGLLLDIAMESDWMIEGVRTRDFPEKLIPFVFNPGKENSIVSDVGLIALAFGGDAQTAPIHFAKAFSLHWYKKTKHSIPRKEYLQQRAARRMKIAKTLHENLMSLDMAFDLMAQPKRPLLNFTANQHVALSLEETILDRFTEMPDKTFPLMVFVGEHTNSNSNQFSPEVESLDRYGDLGKFIALVNTKAGSDIFTKAPHLNWQQELFVQQTLYFILNSSSRDVFSQFRFYDAENPSEESLQYPVISPSEVRARWGKELSSFNRELNLRLQAIRERPRPF